MQDPNPLISMDKIQELRDISADLTQRAAAKKVLLDRPLVKDFKLIGAAIAALPWHALAPYTQHK